MDLEIIVDGSLVPPHALYVSVDGATTRVTVSPNVEPEVLAVLVPDIALAIADAIDKRPPGV